MELRSLADKAGVAFGCLFLPQYRENERAIAFIRDNFNAIVPENGLKQVEDLEFIKKGGSILWSGRVSDRIRYGDRQIVEEYVEQRMQVLHQEAICFDVVNEAFADNGMLKQESPFVRVMGEDFLEKVFRKARETNPQAKLYLADNKLRLWESKWRIIRHKCQSLKKEGVLDGVSLQYHANAFPLPFTPRLGEAIATFREMGLEVLVSECSVFVDRYQTFPPQMRESIQADIYGQILQEVVKNGAKGIFFWTIADAEGCVYHWDRTRLETAEPGLCDRNWQPKLAMKKFERVLMDAAR